MKTPFEQNYSFRTAPNMGQSTENTSRVNTGEQNAASCDASSRAHQDDSAVIINIKNESDLVMSQENEIDRLKTQLRERRFRHIGQRNERHENNSINTMKPKTAFEDKKSSESLRRVLSF